MQPTTTAAPTASFVPCTLQTCPLDESTIGYQPSIAGNVLLLVIFVILLGASFFFGIKYRTWSYISVMACGLVLEVAGYVGRLLLHNDPFQFNYFVQYLVCLTIAPAFFGAAIYFCFERIMLSSGPYAPRIKPKYFSVIFITSDFICLVLQAAGGAIASLSGGTSEQARASSQMGINIMIAGLALQVVSLVIFIAGCVDFWIRVTRKGAGFEQTGTHKDFRSFCLRIGLAVATILILTRSIYRVAELKEGFGGSLARNEVAFMILEGSMIALACICLTVLHPGPCLERRWSDKSFRIIDASLPMTSFRSA